MRRIPKNLDRIWDQEAEKYGLGIEDEIRNLPLPKGMILEAGCGNGRILKYYSSHGLQIVGLEISKKMIQLCKRNTRRHVAVNLLRGDVRFLPFRDYTFDMTVSLGVIEHFPEHQHAFIELARVCSNRLVVSVPYLYSFFHLGMKIAQKIGMSEIEYEDAFSFKHMIQLFEKNGFRVIKIMKVDTMPYETSSWPKRVAVLLLYLFSKPLIWLGLGGWHFVYFCGARRKHKHQRLTIDFTL
jgi:SAM-dependent methyltransferase